MGAYARRRSEPHGMRPGEQGHRRPFRRAGPGRGRGAECVLHARLPAGGRPGVPHRPGRRVRRHEDRRAARRVRHQRIAAAQGQPLRQRRGRIDEQAAEEGARVPDRYTTIEQLRRGLGDCVWWFNNQRLHSTLGYRSPKEFTEQGLVL